MKKIFAVMVVTVVLFVASVAQAACSEKPVSAEKSKVEINLLSNVPVAIITVTLMDTESDTICNTKVDLTTTRNMYYPENGWPKNVDHIFAINGGKSDATGKAYFILSTSQPAGTTVFVTVGDIALGNPDGMPFMYNTL